MEEHRSWPEQDDLWKIKLHKHKVVIKQVYFELQHCTHTLGTEGVASPNMHTVKGQFKDIYRDQLHICKNRRGYYD